MDDQIRPGKGFYILAIVVFVLGIALSTFQLFQNLTDDSSSLQQVAVPGKGLLKLNEAGKYTIFHEFRSSIDGSIYASNTNISGLRCTLTDRSSGERVELLRPSMESSYQIGGREGYSVLEFVIEKPGTYELSAGYEGNREEPEVVLSVGKELIIFKTIFIYMVELTAVMAVSLAIVLVTYFRREKYKKALTCSPF